MSAQDRRIETAVRARDAGRGWSEVADLLGTSVAQAQALVAQEHERRRHAMAHSHTNEKVRGLLDDCRHCHHLRKAHGEDGQCTTCGPERTVYEVVDNRVDPPLCTVVDERPQRPTGVRYDEWYFHPTEVGCAGFQTAQEYRDLLDSLSTSSRFPNDLRHEAYDLGVLNNSGWQAHPGRALQSRLGGPRLKTLVRRARRKAARQPSR